jgi:hypothetical protein
MRSDNRGYIYTGECPVPGIITGSEHKIAASGGSGTPFNFQMTTEHRSSRGVASSGAEVLVRGQRQVCGGACGAA